MKCSVSASSAAPANATAWELSQDLLAVLNKDLTPWR
jgi:hypothetical protein